MSDTGLILLLQTSNGAPVLGLARGGQLVFDSAQDAELSGSRDYRLVLETALSQVGANVSDLSRIFVDIGPGGLGVTRTGVAFANALGFALSVPTVGLPAFELLGHHVVLHTDGGVDREVALLRRAARPYVHFGIYARGALSHYEHCEEALAVEKLASLDISNIAGNIPVEGLPAPLTNVASLDAMLSLALTKADAPTDTRAYPIVEVLS